MIMIKNNGQVEAYQVSIFFSTSRPSLTVRSGRHRPALGSKSVKW